MKNLVQGMLVLAFVASAWAARPSASAAQRANECGDVTAQIRVDSGHLWRPPFGLDRVGAPVLVRVELLGDRAERRDYEVAAYRNGQEVERKPMRVTAVKSRFFGTAELANPPREIALLARCKGDSKTKEIKRQAVLWPEVEADAVARPDRQINPVDLGTVLVPHDWLLVAKGQSAMLDIAAIARAGDLPEAHVRAWFEGGDAVEASLPLAMNQRTARTLSLPVGLDVDRSVLHVSLLSQQREVWRKSIPTMIVAQPPRWPTFGAVATKLRYDASISVKDSSTGKYSPIDYDTGWDAKLDDVVVFLPNGTRFVFWRGSSYVPFWAGLYNTGLSYQWAETVPPPGYVDCVEPLQDKELRYGRVRIIESTPARVHVRWTYESVDVEYKALGDEAFEDFYFYPDGFGTRVLTLTSSPAADYELSEFIVISPQSAYPFEILPERLIEMLYLDGGKNGVSFPYPAAVDAIETPGVLIKEKDPHHGPRIYRIFHERRDPVPAIYFSALDVPTTRFVFKPFLDGGELVSPGYWGNHWPLGRGAPTGAVIDERLYSSPAHISTFTWGLWSEGNRPSPLSAGTARTIDALGRSRQMLTQRWSWLIAKTEQSDDVLRGWAQSYSAPPSLEVKGARLNFPSYSAERRAMRLVARSRTIEIALKPAVRAMNPVFEIDEAPRELASLTLDGEALPDDAYAWDGATLWLQADIGPEGGTVRVQFN